jgi:hypothetical protein
VGVSVAEFAGRGDGRGGGGDGAEALRIAAGEVILAAG